MKRSVMETYTVIDENTVDVGGDRYVFKNKNCTGCESCGLYPFFFDCIKDKRIKCVQKSLATIGKYGCTSLERWGVFVKETKSNNINMEKERKIEAPAGCEIEKVEIVDGVAVVTFREKEQKIPKSWEEFCEMFPIKEGESYIDEISVVIERDDNLNRLSDCDKSCLPNRATAEAVLALCQLIQLRDCYNGDLVPDWTKNYKYVIEIAKDGFISGYRQNTPTILYFKTEELRDEFLRNFRPLIEKLKPLYGIMEGGAE